jgi:GGDEF domain-containing protein
MLLRDARRAWMGSAFKRTPHTVLVMSLRLAGLPGASTPAAEELLMRTGKGMRQAVQTLGPVYQLSPSVCAVLLRDNSMRQVMLIAEAIGAAIDRRSAENPLSPLRFAAGVAALHRDDDPVAIVCLAESCLDVAERSRTTRVVSEGDPEIRQKRR